MFVKNFRGRTAEECIQQLKNEMGKDAVILQSRTVRPIFGRFGTPIHEIVAATGLNTVMTAPAPAPVQEAPEPAPKLTMANGGAISGRTPYSQANSSPRLSLAEAAELAERGDFNRLVDAGVISERQSRTISNSSAAMRQEIGYGNNAYAQREPESDQRLHQLERQIAQLTQVLEQKNSQQVVKPAPPRTGFLKYGVAAEPLETRGKPLAEPTVIDPYQSLVDLMKRAQMADGLIRHVREELRPGQTLDDAKNQLQEVLTRRMLTSGTITPKPGKMTLAALLGPTGVGKTTTIAKLAANLALNTGVSVGMVTLDTQRVAAIQQLQTYGDILNVPTKVAYDKAELERILVEYAQQHVQVVLIDTPGKGPSETLSLAEMSTSLRTVVDLNSYVVVPATLSASNFDHTISRFMKLANPTAIIMTKMDETADTNCLGFLLNAQAKHQLPLAYVTMGSRVPDDLLVADPNVLVSKLMVTNILQN